MNSNQNLEENTSEECRLQQTPISERFPGLKMSGSPDGIQSQLDSTFLPLVKRCPFVLFHRLSAFNRLFFHPLITACLEHWWCNGAHVLITSLYGSFRVTFYITWRHVWISPFTGLHAPSSFGLDELLLKSRSFLYSHSLFFC